MTAHDVAVRVKHLTKQHASVTALDDVSFTLEPGRLVGLLGHNGAGKSTLLRILAAQSFETSGEVEVFGEHPFGLSRGMLSSLGVTVGLASRAPLTMCDEPNLGLDALARQRFYDVLLADFADHPRTIILSTHLIDEVADLFDHVLLIDQGRLIADESAEALRGSAVTVTGPVMTVDKFVARHQVLQRRQLGNTARVSVLGSFDRTEIADAERQGLCLEPLSLQELVVQTSNRRRAGEPTAAKGSIR